MTEGKGIIFLQKDKFDLYSPGLVKIIEFRFVPELIRDLEIINYELLENLIKLFVESNQIPPTQLLIVLADNACFVKDFILPVASPVVPQQPANSAPAVSPVKESSDNSEKLKEDIKLFTDNIPFENVTSRSFPMGNGTKVLAVNKDFYEAIKNSFEKNGFKVSAVYPGVVFQNNIGAKPVMDIISVNMILQQADMVRDNNLLKEDKLARPVSETVEKVKEEKINYNAADSEDKPEKKSNKRLFLMIGVFVVLIIILIVVYIGSQQQPA